MELGAALLGWFVLGLLTGHSYQSQNTTPEAGANQLKEKHEPAALAGNSTENPASVAHKRCSLQSRNKMNYKFVANLESEAAIPEAGILSRVLQKDDSVNITLFGMAAGEEISSHSAPTPAILYFLAGEATVQLGGETVQAQPGSFVFMPPTLPHAIAAKTPVKMLLVQIKSGHSN